MPAATPRATIAAVTHQLSRWDQVADRVLLAAALVFLGLLLRHHWLLITAAVPLDYYEGVMPHITGLLAAGENPYTLPHQPMHADVYPPLYNLLVAPLTAWFDNTLVLHRAVSAGFIFGSLLITAHCVRRRGAPTVDMVLAPVMLYAGLLFYSTPVASTNATGVLFFLLSALLPWYRGFDRTGLALSVLFGLLGFFSKQYFAAGMIMVCAHLLLAVSVRAALLYAAAVLAVVGACLWVVHLTSPYYLDNVLFVSLVVGAVLHTPLYTLKQLGAYGLLHAGLLVLACIAAVLHLREDGLMLRLNRFAWNQGLLARPPDYIWLCCAVATALIALGLGGNPGNWLSYLFQLISPFLLVAGIGAIRRAGLPRLIVAPLLVLFLVQSWQLLPRELRPDTANWDRLDAMVKEHDRLLVSPTLISLLVRHDKEVFQNGHTFYFPFAARKPALFRKDNPELTVEAVWERFNRELYRRVEVQEFELVLAGPWDINGFFGANPPLHLQGDGQENGEVNGADLFRRYYQQVEVLEIHLTDQPGGRQRKIGVWVPREPVP